MNRATATAIVFAALAPGRGVEPDENPFEVVERVLANGYDAAGFASECGLAWPMRPEMLEMACFAGMARWATLRRDAAITAAVEAGCPLRHAGDVAGLSHTAVAKIARR